MGKLRLPGASKSQGLSRTRTQDPDLEKALGSSCRYLDGCPAPLHGWDTEAWGGVLPKSADIAILLANPLPGLLAFLYQYLWAPR